MAKWSGYGMPVPRSVGVLTFHRCINYGSYWQARCLLEGLRSRGIDAVLLDHDLARINRAEWRCAMQPLLPERSPPSDHPLYAAKARRFLDALELLPRSPRFPLDQPQTLEPYDLVIVGSDEIWNLCHPWYRGYPLFFGDGLNAGRLVSYAASFGNHDASAGLDEGWAAKLRAFASISVRDANSQQVIREALDYDAALVLDPCLQFPPPALGTEAEANRTYAAVYGHSFPAWFAHAVRHWADARGYRLLSIGYRNDWADEQRITAGPEDFARLMAGAAAVATNFFHGCVFALLNEKPFVCASSPYRSNKVQDLLRRVETPAHLVTEAMPASDFARALDEPLPPAVASRVAALREQSARYLDHVLH